MTPPAFDLEKRIEEMFARARYGYVPELTSHNIPSLRADIRSLAAEVRADERELTAKKIQHASSTLKIGVILLRALRDAGTTVQPSEVLKNIEKVVEILDGKPCPAPSAGDGQ